MGFRTTCSLHDSRPCGGWDTAAVYLLRPSGGDDGSPLRVTTTGGGEPLVPLLTSSNDTTAYDAGGDMPHPYGGVKARGKGRGGRRGVG